MRSVPIVIDKSIYHLRYTFGAVEDLNSLIPGGFLSIFERDADIGITHLVLWAGLRHENVSYENIGFYLINENAIRDTNVMDNIWKKITYALNNDKWISRPSEEKDDEPDIKTLPEIIINCEKIAMSDFNLLPEELYSLTPREFGLLQDSYGLRDNTRFGLVCATMANIHAKRKMGGADWEPKDFIRTGSPVKPQTVEDQNIILREALRWMS